MSESKANNTEYLRESVSAFGPAYCEKGQQKVILLSSLNSFQVLLDCMLDSMIKNNIAWEM